MTERHCILIVEDEHALRTLLEYKLRPLYDVMTACNGQEALELIDERVPDLIVSDIMMPKMDGFALQQEILRREDTQYLPFIFLTAKADDDSRNKGLRSGVDDYITKPFETDHVLSRIERLLGRVRALKQTQPDQFEPPPFEARPLPKVTGHVLEFRSKARDGIGGDMLYWVASPDGSYLFAVADIMGHGPRAKKYASIFYAYLQTLIHVFNERSPAAILTRINKLVLDDPNAEDVHASILMIRWEPEQNLITYANAGHCRPIIASPSGSYVIEYSDMILGLDDRASYKDTAIELAENSAFVAYTDGLSEQTLPSGDMIGEHGVVAALDDVYNDPEPIDALLEKIRKNSSTGAWRDDVLVFWLQRTGLNWFAPFELEASER